MPTITMSRIEGRRGPSRGLVVCRGPSCPDVTMFLTSGERDEKVSHAAHPGPRPRAARERAGLADKCRGVVAIDVVMAVIVSVGAHPAALVAVVVLALLRPVARMCGRQIP